MMKTRAFKTSVLSTACLLLFAGSAMALPSAGQTVKVDTTSGLGTTNGGEFYLDIQETAGNDNILTFCLETDEYLNNSTTFTIESVHQTDVVGGGSGGPSPDPLSTLTQWVYYNYVNTTFFGTHDNDKADAVQELIWHLEQEAGYETMTTKATWLYTTYSLATYLNDTTYNDYVYALNLKYPDCTDAQSLLVSTPVPEPTVTMLFALGAVGFAGMARRRMNR